MIKFNAKNQKAYREQAIGRAMGLTMGICVGLRGMERIYASTAAALAQYISAFPSKTPGLGALIDQHQHNLDNEAAARQYRLWAERALHELTRNQAPGVLKDLLLEARDQEDSDSTFTMHGYMGRAFCEVHLDETILMLDRIEEIDAETEVIEVELEDDDENPQQYVM